MKGWLRGIISALLALVLCSPVWANTKTLHTPQHSAAINHYLDNISKRYHFNESTLKKWMGHFHYNANVISAMKAPFEAKPYDFYRYHFLSPKRISLGARYWKQHEKTFAKEEHQFGVPADVITSIIGVETLYGRFQGSYSEIDALATLGFYYPPRATFFKHELTEFFLLMRAQHLNPLTVLGSYAGAVGIPQFMPDSYRQYAVDYQRNHRIDLMHSDKDAIASVGNYLAQHGWQRDQPIAIRIQLPQHFPQRYIHDRLPNTMDLLSGLQRYQLKFQYHGILPKHADVIAVSDKAGKEYWLVFANFKAILSYNPSNNYALAVYELSKAIRKQHARL